MFVFLMKKNRFRIIKRQSNQKLVKIVNMKLHLTQAENSNLITAYGDGFIEVNKQRYNQHLIVMPDKLILDWSAKSFNDLSEQDFLQIAALNPEVILFGTGDTHRFVHPKLTIALTDKGIAIECMTTHAACRTYNILMSEGRNIATALLL
jgi:uncharacterized protein